MLMSVKLGQVLLLDSSVTKALIVLHLFLSIHCSLMHMKCGVKASTLISTLSTMWLFPYLLVAIGGFGSIQSTKLIEWYTNGHAFWVLPLLTPVLLVSFDQLKHSFKVLWHSINHLCVFSMLGLLLVPYHCIVILNSFNSLIPCKDSHSQNLSIPFRIADEFASSFSLLFSFLFQHSFSLFVCSEILVALELASMCNKLDPCAIVGALPIHLLCPFFSLTYAKRQWIQCHPPP